MTQPEDKNEPLAEREPRIDFRGLAFPSDRITLGAIRRVHPAEFDTQGLNFFDGQKMGRRENDWPQEALAELITVERMIAQTVFDAAVGGKPHSVLASKWEDDVGRVEELSGYYMRYGVARGQHEARRLIESIESQANKQARRARGAIR